MPSNTARPRIATTAVSIIPVVVPRSSACDVLSSGGGYTLLYLPFSSVSYWRLADRRQRPFQTAYDLLGGALLKLGARFRGTG
jgi:hypothetical protein